MAVRMDDIWDMQKAAQSALKTVDTLADPLVLKRVETKVASKGWGKDVSLVEGLAVLKDDWKDDWKAVQWVDWKDALLDTGSVVGLNYNFTI